MCTIWRNAANLFLHLKNGHWKNLLGISVGQNCSFVYILPIFVNVNKRCGFKTIRLCLIHATEYDFRVQWTGGWAAALTDQAT